LLVGVLSSNFCEIKTRKTINNILKRKDILSFFLCAVRSNREYFERQVTQLQIYGLPNLKGFSKIVLITLTKIIKQTMTRIEMRK